MAKRGDLKWGTVENLQRLIDQYFEQCRDYGISPNIAGLCLALNIHKDTFYYYADGRYERRLAIPARELKQKLIDEIGESELKEMTAEKGIFSNTMLPYQGIDDIDTTKAHVSDCLKTCKTRIECWNWDVGYKLKNPAMAIFALKSAFGYTDQPQEISLSQNNLQLNIKIEQSPVKQPIITVTED